MFFQIFLLRSIKAYLCPNMIKFDGVNFSERRSEEVMCLLTLSVVQDLMEGDKFRNICNCHTSPST